MRERWLETLFSTDPADRSAAESGVRAYYEAAGLGAPRAIVWLGSPAAACHAALLLGAAHDALLAHIVTAFEKMPGPRKDLTYLRETVRKATGASDWDAAVATMGRPLAGLGASPRDDAAGQITTTRIGLWKDPAAAMGSLSDDELFVAETRFWGVLTHALQTQGAMLQGSLSRRYPLAWIVRDEALVGGGSPPPLLAAAWTVARSAGPWWPFRNGAVITERPLEVFRSEAGLLERGDGPAVQYRDGWQVFAWNGSPMPQKWIMAPESIPASQMKQADARFRAYVSTRLAAPAVSTQKAPSKPSSIFKTALPSDATARLELLRQRAGGHLPLYERYQRGERRETWKALVDLGGAVRSDPHAADALAVAYETMSRVEANVRIVIERLQAIGYRFTTDQGAWDERATHLEALLATNPPERAMKSQSPHVQAVREMMQSVKRSLHEQLERAKDVPRSASVQAHAQPRQDAAKRIRTLEKKLGTLPLSLRAFYEVVGSIDLLGKHDGLTPPGSSISPDPLMIASIDDALVVGDMSDDDDESRRIFIAPDDIHKAGESGGEPYEIDVPDDRADGELLNERHGLFFVDYLRLAFRFGGFPGYDGYDREVPPEIEHLRNGLLEF